MSDTHATVWIDGERFDGEATDILEARALCESDPVGADEYREALAEVRGDRA